MSYQQFCLIILIAIEFTITVYSLRECVRKHIENADTVCVCNSSYCDDFPAIVRPNPGIVLVCESNKLGDRFKLSSNFDFRSNDENLETFMKTTEENEITITVNKNIRYQKIYGFGGAFTDSTGYMLSSVDQSLARAIIDSYFSSNGIEYSFGRIPISGTDYSLRPYTYDDVYNDTKLTHFSLQEEDDEWKIPYIKLAAKVCPHKLKLIGSNWSPPVWMKTIEEIIGFGQLKGEVGGEYYQLLANYTLKFIEAYKANGIRLWGLTTQNEPVESHGLNCLKMTPDSQRIYVENNLGPTLAKAGYNANRLKLMILDDNMPFVKNWTDIILSDSSISEYVSGIAVHWYYNEMMGNEVESTLDYMHKTYPQYFVLNTEGCILDGPGNGRWDYAERYAFDIIKQLNHWAVGWIEWNMVLDLTGGPTWYERTGCGGPVYIDPLVGEAYKQPTFYALGHFSKFVSPDSVRIASKLETNVENVSVLTVKRPDNGLVVIVLNRNDKQIKVNIKYENNWLTNKISAHSIQTYIWW